MFRRKPPPGTGAGSRFLIADDQIQPLGEFESFVYAFECDAAAADARTRTILHIGHSLRRSTALIHGKVDRINYLTGGEAPAARAIRSTNGALVEAINDTHGGCFLAAAFVQAQSRPPWEVGGPLRCSGCAKDARPEQALLHARLGLLLCDSLRLCGSALFPLVHDLDSASLAAHM